MSNDTPNIRPIVFLWDNFGPMHNDRCEAVAASMGRPVIGLELFSRSGVYDWQSEEATGFHREILWSGGARPGLLARARGLIGQAWKIGRADWFLCHYERPEIFILACGLRLSGQRVFTMGDSKFDDKMRILWREQLKRFFMLPYRGAIGCGTRSKDYFHFLGLSRRQIAGEYDTLSLDRIRKLAGVDPAPAGLPHSQRHFTIVARFVPKKNLMMALEAYALYRQRVRRPVPLHLCGSGPLEAELRAGVARLGLGDSIVFRGFVQTDEVARTLGRTLALLLPSIEEQFGNVVIEAQAMGLPVILSYNCGARDLLVRNGVNGFVIEPDNPEGLAYFMALLSEDQTLWTRMCQRAGETAPKGDVAEFARAVRMLTLIRKEEIA